MSIRTERVGAIIQRDLGHILQKEYQHDSILTVTKVRMTPDLRVAKVYISIFSPQRDTDNIFEYLEAHNSEIRKELASKVKNQLRHVPELHLNKDDTAEYVNRLEQLFDKIHEERQEKYGSDDEQSENDND